MKPTTALLSIIIICIIGLFITLHICRLEDDVAKYKARAEASEIAFDRLRKSTPIKDASNYPFVKVVE